MTALFYLTCGLDAALNNRVVCVDGVHQGHPNLIGPIDEDTLAKWGQFIERDRAEAQAKPAS